MEQLFFQRSFLLFDPFHITKDFLYKNQSYRKEKRCYDPQPNKDLPVDNCVRNQGNVFDKPADGQNDKTHADQHPGQIVFGYPCKPDRKNGSKDLQYHCQNERKLQ